MDRTEKVVVIIGLTEAIKQYGIPTKFCPTIAIVIGILIGYAESPNAEGILEGILLGGTVTGGYAITKKTAQGIMTPFKKEDIPERQITIQESPKADYSHLEPDDYRGV